MGADPRYIEGMLGSASWIGEIPTPMMDGVLVVVAMVAGIINTMAGGGSLLLVPLLVGIGLPAPVANGTIRVAALVQSASAALTFHRRGIRDYGLGLRLLVPTLAGAALGTWVATKMSDSMLRPIFGLALAGWAVFLLLRPGSFVDAGGERKPFRLAIVVGAVAIGVYGGLLQAGVGFPLIALLVFGLGLPPVNANGLKVGLVAAYSCVSLPMFAVAGQVAWREGLLLSAGSMLGGWLGSRWQIRAGATVVRYFLIATVLFSGVLMIASAL